MSSLFLIHNQIMSVLIASTDVDTGEIDESKIPLLDALGLDLEIKALNVAKYIKSLEYEAEMIRNAERDLAERRKKVERKAESLRNYMTFVCDGQTFKDAEVEIKYSKSESVEIADTFICPEDYLRIKKEIDKIKIKEALKQGIEIEGAKITKKNNIIIK